jgi:hypothetical protein
MPYEGNEGRREAVATKVVQHGAPVTEDGFVGTASKATQINRFVDPSSANIRRIEIGERFVMQMGHVCEVLAANITGGLAAAPVGTLLHITTATNVVTPTSGAGTVPYGRVDAVLTATGRVRVNLNEKV